MRAIGLGQLKPVEELTYDLYHESGVLLHQRGEPLLPIHLSLMKRFQIRKVLAVRGAYDLQLLRERAMVKAVRVTSIKREAHVVFPVYDRRRRLLLRADSIITPADRPRLLQRGVREVYIAKDAREVDLAPVINYKQKLREITMAAKRSASGGGASLEEVIERRRHTRHPLKLTTRFRKRRRSSTVLELGSRSAAFKDLSQSGIGFYTMEKLEQGDVLKIHLRSNRGATRVNMEMIVEVVRVLEHREHGFDVGAKFLLVDENYAGTS